MEKKIYQYARKTALFWFVGISIVPLTIAAVLVYNQSSNIIETGY